MRKVSSEGTATTSTSKMSSSGSVLLRVVASSVAIARKSGATIRNILKAGDLKVVDKVKRICLTHFLSCFWRSCLRSRPKGLTDYLRFLHVAGNPHLLKLLLHAFRIKTNKSDINN